jgi:carbon storage regulator
LLILTRRVGESVVIDNNIVVTVVEVRGDAVRIGIAAPRSVDVHREEVYRELQKANRQAASPDASAIEALKSFVAPTAVKADDPAEPMTESAEDV